MSFHDHEPEEYNRRFGVYERQKKELQRKMENSAPLKLPNGIDLEKLKPLLMFSDKYEISIQFWPDQIAVYISKEGVDLADFGGDFLFAIDKSIEYLNRINNTPK